MHSIRMRTARTLPYGGVPDRDPPGHTPPRQWLLNASVRGRVSPSRKFLDTDVSYIKILLFSSRYFLQMSKLNSLLEATRGSDKKDTSDLTIRCVQKLFFEGETRPRTSVFKSHPRRRPPWAETPHSPPRGQTNACENITFANFVCGR